MGIKQYIIYDLEATCDDKSINPRYPHEIIEIGAVRLNETAQLLDSFQTFIKPTTAPILTDFCKNLTGIRQGDVDNAPFFAHAICDFEQWITIRDADTMLISWGYYDKTQLLEECENNHYNGIIVDLLANHRSIKHDFAKLPGKKRCGMKKALEILGIPLTGTHHRGLDDAKNIAKIFTAVFAEWRHFIKTENK
ncbi:MAG: exonuclease domain-containing protein [Defluviitaleaceae bacterium]|nr:exonuclease domain-containing protein [Defluviitaleaceae bacterium]